MKIGRIVFIAVVAVSMAAIALAGEVKVTGTNISLKVPKGWTADTSPSSGPMIVLYSKPLEGFKAMINLSADDLGGKSPQVWLAEYKSGLAQNIGKFRIVKEGDRQLGGAPYYALDFRGMQGKAMLHWLQVIHFQEGKAWIFSAVTLERQTKIYMRTFQRTFSSIYFPPPPPENFAAQVSSETEVTLSWTAHPLAKGGYEIQRRDAQMGVWKTIATVPVGTSTYTDTEPECEMKLLYRVKCLNPKGDSNWSVEVPAILGVCPVELEGATPEVNK